jgi:phage baseplate assembly protein W
VLPVTTSGDIAGAIILYDEDDGNSLLLYIGSTGNLPAETSAAPIYITFSNSQDKVFSYTAAGPVYNIPAPLVTFGTDYQFSDTVQQPARESESLTSAVERAIGGADRIYKDLNNLARAHPLTGDITRVFDKNAINKSLENILLTNPFDVPFEENLGIGLNNFLFEMNDSLTRREMQENIARKIAIREPRISVRDIRLDSLVDGIQINIYYFINALGTTEEFNLFLERY